MRKLLIALVSVFAFSCNTLSEKKLQYFPNGTISSEQMLHDGKLNGPSIFYYENGRIKSRCEYLNDKKEGLFVSYFQSGTVSEQVFYRGDIPTYQKKYDNKGHLREICDYDSIGRLIDRRIFDTTGATDFTKMTPIAYADSDTLSLGQTTTLHVRLANANPQVYTDGHLIITNDFDGKGLPIDTLFISRSSNVIGFEYDYEPTQSENNVIKGLLSFRISTAGKELEDIYYFNYTVFVRP